MIGLMVRCVSCGTDASDVVYYVGEEDTHCGDCWIVAVQSNEPEPTSDVLLAKPDFVIDGMIEAIEEQVGNNGPLAAPYNLKPPVGVFTRVVPLNNLRMHRNTGSAGN